MTLEELGIKNDMPRGWVRGKNQPKWHRSLYNRWKHMWVRCKNPLSPDYATYKDIPIDESFRLLSIYVDTVSKLINFDRLCDEPNNYHIDKDLKYREYSPKSLSIVHHSENRKEMFDRCGHPYNSVKATRTQWLNRKRLIAINIETGHVRVYTCAPDAKRLHGFDPSHIGRCAKGLEVAHKGYKWYYVNFKHFKTYRVKGGCSHVISRS